MAIGKMQYFLLFAVIVVAIRNLMVPLDRAHCVVLVTTVEQLEHVPRRIR